MDLKSLLEQMTLEEKAALCTGLTPWDTVPVERLGVPPIIMSDGPHGVRRVPGGFGGETIPATCFPTASALASTWDVDLVRELGEALADECLSIGVDIVLGPGTNMKRTPLCGRNFEYFSEDPHLAGRMAASLINGVQSKGVGTSLKHFAANNQEEQRFTIDAQIDERTLHELYLAAFEYAVKNAKPWTVMCAYNRLNGTYASQHHYLLTDVLKDRWGFEGVVVSDWGAVHDRVEALDAGLDLEMPGPQPHRTRAVVEAVRSGKLDEAALDKAVMRLLSIIDKAQQTPKGGTPIDIDAHHALARRIAADAMVLLKNEGGLLPLHDVSRIAVIGVAAKEPYFQGGGSSHINPTRVDNPFDELQKLAGDAALAYAPGYTMDDASDPALIEEAVALARDAEIALLYVALPPLKESEGYDRPDIDLMDHQVALIQAVAAVQPKTVVILNNGSAVAMKDWIDGPAAVLEAWMMGQAGGGAIADVLFGKVNPSGHLAETFPIKLSDTPAYINYPGELGKARYGEGVFIGYRYYDTTQTPVQFPFGYGLSYTTFEYSNLRVSAEAFKDVDGLTVSVDVTNSGPVAGKAVVQLYVHDHEASVARPEKELRAFGKVALEPGETKTVSFDLDARAFAFYHAGHHDFVAESGAFDILIGASSADIRQSATVTLDATLTPPTPITRDTLFRDWRHDPRAFAAIEPILQKIVDAVSQIDPNWTMENIGWADELLLENVFGFWGAQVLDDTPEQTVKDVLATLYSEE
ncbi:MAG TPA: glycoside hydrolase family 3 C-terminal domain-containing protein [Aggregatilinea sp.]|uniref:glycoside hydrolase family 3 C-terminal domain-containing protein n=1 Tax=Aggregatilinea sp. TaxID=2806333 RepID=UPI002B8DFFD3|nr:glycoside hydrolase family 3 C-terminal domain-containing protein [Aggregatilinea sp.]HML24303.1 glycoside hydrolase family 3 C-terminal domain-containing protein [Aggregatilinea sp.]